MSNRIMSHRALSPWASRPARSPWSIGAILGSLALAAPALAQAQEAAREEAPSVFAGDVGNALWTIVIFVLLLVVLGKYAWGPILASLQKREEFIRESLEKAKRDRDEAEARLREYEARLALARTEATEIVETGRRDSLAVARQVQEEAKREAERILERARRELELAKGAAVKELYDTSARLATEIAARILGRELAPQDHDRLIAEAVAEI
ncbi:MAG TPA: F0F1 ATP synthase subunit B, partial [Dongiaceae bacterium]